MSLIAYLFVALTAWLPNVPSAMRTSVAEDIAAVVEDPSEPAIWGEGGKALNALVLASLAYHESGLASYVDEGKCNDELWRKSPEGRKIIAGGDCDSGYAFSIFQIHTGRGLALSPRGIRYLPQTSGVDARLLIHGGDLTRDRRLAVRVALHIVRSSVDATGTLCGYSGESVASGCPKAMKRFSWAKSYLANHAFIAE
jgi:hypothetical protein